jgi:hypothetical protein
MKAQAKTRFAVFGGAAAVALMVGLGGVGVNPASSPSTATTHQSTSVASARPHVDNPAAQSGVHTAVLAGCIPGANC